MKQRSTTITPFCGCSNEQSKGMSGHDISFPKKNKIPYVLLLSILWVCLGLSSYAQTMKVYPPSLSASVKECNGSTVKTFSIENHGADNLSYTNTVISGFNSSKAGNTLADFTNFSNENGGMVLIGNYLYVVNDDNYTLDKYDIYTHTQVTSYHFPFGEPWGIAYDGTYIWVGEYGSGNIHNFDLEGNSIGSSISMPMSEFVFTYDGQYFVVAEYDTSDPDIYKVDHSGNIVETYYSSGIDNLYNMTWVPNHLGGHLWVIDQGDYFRQFNLSEGNANEMNSFYFYYWDGSYSIVHDGTDLWIGDWNGALIKVDDGIDENVSYIKLSSTTGTVNPGSTSIISATFDAKGLKSDTYNGTIAISSNDPSNPDATIDYSFTLDGKPDLNLSASTIGFGNVINSTESSKTLWIHNTGCAVLYVSDISSSDAAFIVDKTSFDVNPFDSTKVTITFTPTTTSNYNSTLTISNSDTEVTVALSGAGIEPPALLVTPKTLSASLSCGGTTTKTFSIANNGSNSLAYKIDSIGTSNASNLGTVLGNYSSFNSNCRGTVWVDKYIYAVHTNSNLLDKYDPSTQTIIASYPIHGNAAGIAYDGKDLWIGCQDGHLYNYDLVGNAIGSSISIPFTGSWPALAYDGKYFIVAPCYNSNTNIYKVDHSGNVIETYTSNYYISGMTWVPKHNNGHLWLEDDTNDLRQVNLYDGNATTVNSVYFSADVIGLSHDGKNLFIGYWDGELVKVDDGISESTFYSLSKYRGAVTTTPSTITVTFNAGKLGVGMYTDDIIVKSNDPINISDTVACTLVVSGLPAMNLSATAFNFGNLINGLTATDTLWLHNTGCDTLKISDINGLTTEFSVSDTAINVLPYDSTKVIIKFAPLTTGNYSTTLTITSNVPDVSVNLSGSGIGAPVLSVDPKVIDATVNQCNGTTSKTFTVHNTTGQSALKFTSYTEKTTLAFVLSKLDEKYSDITSLIPGKFNFSLDQGSTGNNIDDGGDDMYDGANYLSTNYKSNFNYTDGVITSNGVMGSNGSYFTKYHDGLFVLAADLDKVDYFNIYGNVGSDGSGSFDAAILTATVKGVTYLGFVTRNYDAGDPSINHLIIVPKNDLLNQTYNSTTDDEDHTIKGLTSSTRMYYLLYAGSGGSYIDNSAALAIMEKFLNTVTVAPADFIGISPSTGTIATGNSSTITVNFNAKGMASGTYTGNILVNANDPVNSVDTVDYTFTVNGSASINLSATSFNFGNVVKGLKANKNLWVKNSGCDTLKITDINSTLPVYTISDTAAVLLPKDSANFIISCLPTTTGNLTGTLTIVSNIDDVTVNLSGLGVAPPTLLVSPTSLSATLSCGGSTTKTFAINNNGSSNLIYNMMSFNDNVETSNHEWTTEVYGGNDDLWHKSHLDYHSSSTSWWCGIESNGNYENGNRINTALISPAIDLTQTSSSVLNFWENYDTEGGSYDWCMVDISTDNGKTWSQLRGEGVNGSSGGWINTSLDLTPFCGQMVKIRFYFDTRDNEENAYSGWFVDDITIVGAPDTTQMLGWLSTSSQKGTVTPANSSTINVEFNAAGLSKGIYTKDIYISSNDPINLLDTVACTLTVEGIPTIELSKSTITFPSVFVNSSATGSLTISNSGCDTLKISDIVSDNTDFASNAGKLNILPGKSEKILISFTPSTDGIINGSITIFNNLKDSTIQLSGEGILPSVVSVSSNTPDGFYNEGKVVDLVVTFSTEMQVNTSGGTPKIALNTTPTAYATYISGSGSRDLVFEYTVGAGENSADLDYTTTSALTLEGGEIIDNYNNVSDLTLPTVGTFANTYNIVIDNVQPTVSLTTNAADPTPQNPIHVKVEFNEKATGLELTDFVVGNGSASNLQSLGDSLKWMVDITPVADGLVTVDLPAGSAQDLAGNGNVVASQLSRTYDSALPLLILSSANSLTNLKPFVVNITSSVSVTGLDLTDFVVTNGTASNLTVVTAGTEWTINVTPTADGDVKIKIPAGSVLNGSSNSNPEDAELTVTYDGTAPTVTISSTSANPTNVSPVAIKIAFSEKVTGFTSSDFTITNGTASNLLSSDNINWTANITPTASGVVTVNIAAGALHDLAGNANVVSNQFSITYDATLPIISNLVVSNITNTTADAAFTCNKDAEVYYAVLTGSATAPSISEVLAGTGTAVAYGHTTVVKNAAKTVTINGFTPNTAYKVYAAAKDIFNNVSPIVNANFTTTNTEVNVITGSNISIYPNPVSADLKIKLSDIGKETRYSLFSIAGELLEQGPIDKLETTLNMRKYAPSVYILRISDNKNISNYRVVKE